MSEETRKQRAERIARAVLEQLNVKQIARVDELQPGTTWKLTVYGRRVLELEFDTHASDENMRRDLMRKVREAFGGGH